MQADMIRENSNFSSQIVTLHNSDKFSQSQSDRDKESLEHNSSHITSIENNCFYTFPDSVDVILNCLLCQELVAIVSKLLKDETDTIAETFIFADEIDNYNFYQDIDESQYSTRSLTSSVILDSSDKAENYVCQVEIVDEKQIANQTYGLLMERKGVIYFSLKNQQELKKNPICALNFLLKTEKIWNELNNLLHNHAENKSITNFKEKIRIKDRRLTSIEQSMKCQFNFPNNMKVFRYKGNNCIKMRILSTSNTINLQALNLFRIKIPKLYKECIFTEQIINFNDSASDYKWTKIPTNQKLYFLEQPFTDIYNKKSKNFYNNNYSAHLNSTTSWN